MKDEERTGSRDREATLTSTAASLGEATEEEPFALIHLQASEQSAAALERAVRRIRQQIRARDLIFSLEGECALLLRSATLAGAEAVMQRLHPLLADVEHSARCLAGEAARQFLRELQRRQPRLIEGDRGPQGFSQTRQIEEAAASEEDRDQTESQLPYLAFLSSYPSLRLLHLLPYELAQRYRCVPIGAERGTLTLATARRLDRSILDHLQTVTQRAIFQVRCEPEMISEILHYWEQQQRRLLDDQPQENPV
ncbi:MAG: hypothetical protein IRZ31_10635 [Thermogemmatispora sp.]|uniref:GspE/PulE/PilB domain-containing protein n=1 Tax=Thermogemmatispora sp. TaxID=1968838 RepID=UPI0026328171|nr:hypothetical protein [Thermogemmatispora sp.]MBX5457345.1 hypothetical protein [Thermogemmatispora sp.]